MIRSMTGFGRAAFEVEGVGFSVEIRSVNHRHLDASVRLPRLLSALETEVKRRLRARFGRGKVDVSVGFAQAAGPGDLELDRDVARRYYAFAAELARELGMPGELDVATLLSLPGVTRMVERALPEDAAGEALLRAVEQAAEASDAMRRREGEALEAELRARLSRVSALVEGLEARAGQVVEAARERLRRRTDQIRQDTGLLDEARLHQEIVFAADRLDVTEELVRLRSHLAQVAGVLDAARPGEAVGRRLDFLLQELGREANTVGSKGSDAEVAHAVVELKTELERIREQVQNIE